MAKSTIGIIRMRYPIKQDSLVSRLLDCKILSKIHVDVVRKKCVLKLDPWIFCQMRETKCQQRKSRTLPHFKECCLSLFQRRSLNQTPTKIVHFFRNVVFHL